MSTNHSVGCEVEMSCSAGLDGKAFANLLHSTERTIERQPRLSRRVEDPLPTTRSNHSGYRVAQKSTTEGFPSSTAFTIPGQLTLSGPVEEHREKAGSTSNRVLPREHRNTEGQTVSTTSTAVERQLTLSERVDEFMKNHSFSRDDSLTGQKRNLEERGDNA